MSLWIVLVVRFLAMPASTRTMLGPTPSSQPALVSRYWRAELVMPREARVPAALDSKVMSVTESVAGRRPTVVRFGGLDWEARAQLETLSHAKKPGG